MGLNREYIGLELPTVTYKVTEEAIYKYAWAIGARNMAYYNFGGLMPGITLSVMAPPSFAVVYELPLVEMVLFDERFHGGSEQMSYNLLMLVHGDQEMAFYKPIRPGDIIISQAQVKSIEDKSSGEIAIINVTSRDQTGQKVVESDWGIFVRGIGSGQKKKKDERKEQSLIGESQPVFRKIIRVDKDITYRYAEASGDRNPIHIDEKVAKAAGLNGVVVHGLCTLSMTMRAIIECYLDGDPGKLRKLGCRFASPVYPGDTLIADGWEMGNQDGEIILGFEVKRQSDGVKVIKNGMAEVMI